MRLFTDRNPLHRLYRISFGSAIVLSIPGFILVTWMIVDAYLNYSHFSRKVGKEFRKKESPCINLDIMHLYLNKALEDVLMRSNLPEMPTDNTLPTIQISIPAESFLLPCSSDQLELLTDSRFSPISFKGSLKSGNISRISP